MAGLLDNIVMTTYSRGDYNMMTKQEFRKLRNIWIFAGETCEGDGFVYRTISRYETGEIQIPKVTELALRYIAEKVKKQEM